MFADKTDTSFATVIHVCALLPVSLFFRAEEYRNIPSAPLDGSQLRILPAGHTVANSSNSSLNDLLYI